MLRSMNGHPSGYPIPLTLDQRRMGTKLLNALNGGGDGLPQLHEFYLSLLAPAVESHEWTQFDCPVHCYLAVTSLREDGAMVEPAHLTQRFAIIKYLARGSCLYEAYARRGEHSSLLRYFRELLMQHLEG